MCEPGNYLFMTFCTWESVGENTADIVCDIAKKLNVNLVSNDISVSHRLPSAKGHKQIIARFTHAQKRSELLKATQHTM
jgi:hypothetical protein